MIAEDGAADSVGQMGAYLMLEARAGLQLDEGALVHCVEYSILGHGVLSRRRVALRLGQNQTCRLIKVR